MGRLSIPMFASNTCVIVWQGAPNRGEVERSGGRQPHRLAAHTSRPRLTRTRSILTCRRGSWLHAARFSYAWSVNATAKKAVKPSTNVDVAMRRFPADCQVVRVGGHRSQVCRCSRDRHPSGCDSAVKGRRAGPPRQPRGVVGGWLTPTRLRRGCRPQRPWPPSFSSCSAPKVLRGQKIGAVFSGATPD